MTGTLKTHIAVLPAASDVLHVTSVSPTSKKSPEFTSTVPTLVSIQQVVLTTPSTMSKAFTIQSTVLPLVPMLTLTAMSTGHNIFGLSLSVKKNTKQQNSQRVQLFGSIDKSC